MGLDELKPFEPAEKVVEYMLTAGQESREKLVGMTLRGRSVCNIHRHLSYSVFIDKPPDSLSTLESAGNHHGLAVLVLQRFAGK